MHRGAASAFLAAALLFLLLVPATSAQDAPHGDRRLSLAGRFVYSDSFREARDDACVTPDDPACYPAEQLLSTIDDGLYTRFVFDLVANGATQAEALNGTARTVEARIRYVAAKDSGLGEGNYAQFSAQCPPGAPCQGIENAVIDITLTDVRIGYPLRRICFSKNSNEHSTGSYGTCMMPQAYFPIDDLTTCGGDGAFPADCAGSDAAPNCFLSTSCREQPCDSSAFPLTPAQLDSRLDANSGADRDPTTGVLDALNTRCVENCCSACAAQGYPDDAAHQIWALGPPTFAFQALAPKHILATAECTVTVLDTGATRTVTVENLDIGSVEMDSSGDAFVRATVLDLAAEFYANLPDPTGGVILISDYSERPTGFIRMSPDPARNAYSYLPNNGRGLTPTQSNLAGNFSVAYLNQTSLIGNGEGYYGVRQGTLVSDRTDFSHPDSCYNGYFDDHIGVPGWQIKAGTADVPIVPTMSHMTARLNRASSQFLSGTVPADEIDGTYFLLPGESLEQPRYSIYDDTLYYFVPDGDLLTLLGQARDDPDHNVQANPGWVDLRDIRQRAENVITLALDVSTDFLPYNGITASAAIVDGTGCIYSWEEAFGEAVATVRNLANEAAVTYDVIITCDTTDPGVLEVERVSPSNLTLPLIGPQGVIQTQPASIIQLANGTEAAGATEPPTVYCQAEVFDTSAATDLRIAARIFQCLRIPPPGVAPVTAGNGTLFDRSGAECLRNENGDIECSTDTTDAQNAWAIATVLAVFGVFLLIVACCVCCACIGRLLHDDDADKVYKKTPAT